MNKLSNINLTASTCLLLLATSLLFVSCKKEDDFTYTPPGPPTEPLIEQVDGLVKSRLDGLGIPDIKVELWDQDLFSGDLIASEKTDGAGKFQFTGKINGLNLQLPEYTNDYQNPVWLNGKMDSLFFALGTYVKLNSVFPQEITLELYPITRFKILASNVAPAAANDVIKIKLKNMKTTGGLVDSGVHQFELGGLQDSALIEGEVKIENILTIEYEVISDAGTELFSKTVVCEPGRLTTINIDY